MIAELYKGAIGLLDQAAIQDQELPRQVRLAPAALLPCRLNLCCTSGHSCGKPGKSMRAVASEDQARKGFKDYDAMCVICHSAPGKERSYISKGLRPEPPNLADTSERWNSAELFWIIKNGVKMTAMPAFGPTHQDEQIWNIVSFVRRLPRLSAEQFKAMESEIKKSSENEKDHNHH